ncbi:MAG: DNA alkylation repair protein [Saprospiraceae bacterium]
MLSNTLFLKTKDLFEQKANQTVGQKFKAYMKGHFEFYGVMAPERNNIEKSLRSDYKILDVDQMLNYVSLLWQCEEREMQYTAMEVLKYRKKLLTTDHLPYIENLIVTKSWWDSIDSLAPNIAGHLFTFDDDIKMIWIDKWSNSQNMWLNRSTIIHQLRYKTDVNLELLFALVEKHSVSKEFFINKASGWALRQASKFYPQEINQFINDHPELSNLTKKEGRKYLKH